MIDIQLVNNPIDLQGCIDFVRTSRAGALMNFIGTVRNHTEGKKILNLIFEAYRSMALRQMHEVAKKAKGKWKIEKIAIHHRIGTLKIGEIAVVIAVSAIHRKEAFDACKYAIDWLKESVPIWKKEIFENGSIWVNAHP